MVVMKRKIGAVPAATATCCRLIRKCSMKTTPMTLSNFVGSPQLDDRGAVQLWSWLGRSLVLSGTYHRVSSSISLSWCRGRFPWSRLLSDQRDSPVAGKSDRRPCCAGRAASQVVVQTSRKLWFPTVAVLGPCGYGRPCDHATVQVPQIQFIAPFEDTPVAVQRRARTVQLDGPCLAGMVAAMRGSCCSFAAFFGLRPSGR